MATTFNNTFGDIEYDISINGGDVFLETVYTDLGIDPEDLYFIPKGVNSLSPEGTPVMKSLAEHLCDEAYQKFLDDWGSEKALNDANYSDDSC